jgi:uncharacterized protein (DUF1800 family)
MFRRATILALVGVLAATGCDPNGRRLEAHILNRIGYGPDPWSTERLRELGAIAYIEEQLHPHLLDDSALEADIAVRYRTQSMSYRDLRFIYHEYGAANGGPSQIRKEMGEAKILRAVRSKRQLEQILVDFWFNHFNVLVRRDLGRWASLPYERDAIRPHVLGRFEDMLLATARHPAMINYLNNQVNFREGFVRGAKTYGINENYAREVLELHTVGAEADYSLGDIQNVARVFTGWTTPGTIDLGQGADQFQYLDAGHDKDPKSVMGEFFLGAGGGIAEGEALVRYLARHPLTAERIARKLCYRFISETPPEAVVAAARDVFLSTDGDLRQVMRTILRSQQFRTMDRRAKVKRPFAFVTSLARAVGVADEIEYTAQARLEVELMGEPPYEAAPPIGYPEASIAWVGEGSFLRQVNFAYRAAFGTRGFAPQPPTTGNSQEVVDQLAERLIRGGISASTRAAAMTVFEGHGSSSRVQHAAAALLASPEFLSQ